MPEESSNLPTHDLPQTSPPFANSAETTPTNSQFKYVGFGRRLLAFIIDSLILWLVSAVITLPFDSWSTYYALSFLINASYFIFFWVYYNGQTLGNRILAIRVIKENGNNVDIGTGVVRYIGYIISSIVFGLGFIWVIFDSKKQGWHDKIARTLVIETGEKPKTLLASLIVVILLLISITTAAVLGYAIYRTVETEGKAGLERKTKGFVPSLSPIQLRALENEVFLKVNEEREKNGLTKLTLDNKLCAYAQRRLEQLAGKERYDRGKGFYEDMANPAISQAFFDRYQTAGEDYYKISPLTESGDILAFWKSSEKSIINDNAKTHGCPRANEDFLIFVSGKIK